VPARCDARRTGRSGALGRCGWNTRGPGRRGTGRNTDRRAGSTVCDPQVKAPTLKLGTGFVSRSLPASRAARAQSPTARPHGRRGHELQERCVGLRRCSQKNLAMPST
jgi:hypothetical protein